MNAKKSDGAKTGKWTSRIVFAAIVQAALATGLTAYLLYQAVFGVPAASRIVAGGGAGTWLTVGFLGYLILGLLVTGVTAFFYRYLESGLGKTYRGWTNALAWAHLVLWNVGVVGSTWLMMHAGYRGGAAALPTAVGGLGWNSGAVHTEIMAAYPPYIAAFMGLAVLGVALGLLGYVITWARPVAEKAPAVAAVEA